MFFFSFEIDNNIINIDIAKVIEVLYKDTIYILLEYKWFIR